MTECVKGKGYLKSLRAKLNEVVKEKKQEGLCRYAIQFLGGNWRVQYADICYARARYHVSHDRQDCVNVKHLCFLLWDEYEGVTVDRDFVRYILQRSIFKDVFLTKNIQAAWRYGVEVDVNKPCSQVIAGMTAVREAWEFPHQSSVWKLLVKEGIHEDVAWLCSRFLTMYEEGFCSVGSSHHRVLARISLASAKALLTEGMLSIGKSLAEGGAFFQVWATTREDGGSLSPVLMKGAVEKGAAWNKYEVVSREQLLINVKQIEKEIFQ